MTDITDQDRRVAHEWAASIDTERKCWSDRARAIARVILATVDAPAPTLADEIRGLPDFTMSGDHCVNDCHEHADDVAFRVEQMERDLTEARAEVERLYAERTSKDSLLVDLPDPADVKPGEAWIVECRGERRTAVKDNDDTFPWCTVNADGWFNSEKNEDVTLVSRLVPAPRVITNPEELRALPTGAAIEHDGTAWWRCPIDSPRDFETTNRYGKAVDLIPATVLWGPEA